MLCNLGSLALLKCLTLTVTGCAIIRGKIHLQTN